MSVQSSSTHWSSSENRLVEDRPATTGAVRFVEIAFIRAKHQLEKRIVGHFDHRVEAEVPGAASAIEIDRMNAVRGEGTQPPGTNRDDFGTQYELSSELLLKLKFGKPKNV